MDINQLSEKIQQAKGERARVEKQIAQTEEKINQATKRLGKDEAAQIIIKAIAQNTQKALKYKISEPVSLALKAVFDDPYSLTIDFPERRGKIEADINFERNGNLLHPMYGSGLGPVDVAGFGLRISCLTMACPRPTFILILDEPFKHLKGIKENIRVIQMVKEVSKSLSPQLQVIMVNDERVPLEEIEKGADKIINVKIRNGVSNVD